MCIPGKAFLAIPWALLLGVLLVCPAHAAQPPAWWADARAEAARDGYGLVDDQELESLRRDPRVLILDVRPDYEFARGHMPGAVNMEFHLGDERELPPDRARRLVGLLGPERGRTLVVYCRSYL